MSLTRRQGFDEFMNLVIDEAVEVTLANPKKETPEERRQIG
jgi:small nuclear ribonucleoprotein E